MTVYRRPDPIPKRQPVDRQLGIAIRPRQDDLHRLAARQIFMSILSGQFAEGTVLPNEAALSQQLAVSRTALREAIKGLASKGLVESRRKRGTLVLPRKYWNLLDPDLITWSRGSGKDQTSRYLWGAVASVMPILVAQASRTRTMPRLDRVLQFVAACEADAGGFQAKVDSLVEIAGCGDNPYLASLVALCLNSLVRDDPDFLRRVTGGITAARLRDVAEAIARGDARSADRAETIFHGEAVRQNAEREAAR